MYMNAEPQPHTLWYYYIYLITLEIIYNPAPFHQVKTVKNISFHQLAGQLLSIYSIDDIV